MRQKFVDPVASQASLIPNSAALPGLTSRPSERLRGVARVTRRCRWPTDGCGNRINDIPELA